MTSTETALVLTDPQNDFLSEQGVAWELVGRNVEENGTVENIERLLETATAAKTPVFVSPHYYYPFDHEWQFGGTLEQKMHEIAMFDRPDRCRSRAPSGRERTGSTATSRTSPTRTPS